MVDIIPYIAEKIEKYCPVEQEYPDIVTDCPLATITEVANVSDVIIDNKERMTYHSIQVDVWDYTAKGVMDLVGKIRSELVGCGFSCDNGRQEFNGDIKHYTMRFRGKIDNVNYRIYR